MCGIAGFVIAPGDVGKINTRVMTAVLGYEMKARGKDATGIYTVDSRGRWKIRKRALPADVFLAGREGIGTNARTALIHTRAATQGKASNNGNNHPILHGDIVGIHNGIIFNDDKLFAHYEWKRNAEVDSEAVFAALNYLDPKEALENIDGSWAIAWADINEPNRLYLCRGSTSPLHYATTVNGSVVFASTATAVKEALEYSGVIDVEYKHITMADEGFYATIDPDGGIRELEKVDTSGKDAVGARKIVASTTNKWQGHNNNYGYTWGDDDDWKTGAIATGPTGTPHVRYQVTGDPKNPKVGDRRKFCETVGGPWIFEVCSSTAPLMYTKVISPHRDNVTQLSLPSGVRSDEKENHDPFDRDDALDDWLSESVDWEGRFGFAHEGDLISFDKSKLGGWGDHVKGHLVAEVLDENDDGTLTVEFRTARITRGADYEVLISHIH